ncbi:MAG: aminopeptidase P family N-terminal domain-containing protein, partial [Firmicutes bacterium]|nr:aminopeptidase P family N-terminal domain-containing protein [Bacillota bacterium]
MTTTAVERLRSWMQAQDFTCVLLRTRANFAWLTGGKDNHIVLASEQGVADLLVFATRVVCLTLSMEQARIAEEEFHDTAVEVMAAPWYSGLDATRNGLLQGEQVASDIPYPGAICAQDALKELRRNLDAKQIVQYRDTCTCAAIALEDVE